MRIGLTEVARDIIVAALLTNCLTLLQGSQSHTFFSGGEDGEPYVLEMPTIEKYFGVEEFDGNEDNEDAED